MIGDGILYRLNMLFVDIGSANIKIICGRKFFGKLIIDEFGMISTPENSLKNGYVIDACKISSKINEFIKNKKIKCNYISFVIHSTDIYNRNIEIPIMSKENTRAAIEWEMDQYIKGSITDYNLSFELLGKSKKSSTVFVVIVPNAIIAGYGQISNIMGIKIKFIDVAVKCVLRFFKGKSSEFVVMDFGHESIRTSLFVNDRSFADRELAFDRDAVGLETLNIISGKEINIRNSFKQYEAIIQYFHTLYMKEKIDVVYVIGGGSILREINDYIIENIDISTYEFGFFDKSMVNFDEDLRSNIRFYINTLGLLLRC